MTTAIEILEEYYKVRHGTDKGSETK